MNFEKSIQKKENVAKNDQNESWTEDELSKLTDAEREEILKVGLTDPEDD